MMKQTAKIIEIRKRNENPNFLTALFTIIFMAFAGQGLTVPEDAPERVADAIATGDAITMMIALVPLLIVPSISLYNRVKEVGFDWSFVKDRNFITHIVSAIMIALELGGVLPPDTGKVLAGSIEGLNTTGYMITEPAVKERVLKAA